MKKQLIATAAVATGLVGTIGTAHADTVELPLPTTAKNEPALVEKEAPKKVEVKTATKEEVAELGASATQAQADADKAKEVLDQANEKSDKAEKEVEGLKQAKDDAQKTADKATPEAIKDAEKKVETAKASVPTAEQGVSTAKTAKDDADHKVAVHGKTVGTKQAEVTQAQNAVNDAKAVVKDAEDALNNKGLEEAKAKEADAIKAEATSKQAQADAQKTLDNAKAQDSKRADALNKAEKSVSDAKAQVQATTTATKGAQKDLDAANTTYNKAVSTLDALQENKKATITLAPKFIEAVKEKIVFRDEIRKNGDTLSSEYINKKSDELYDRIVNSQLENAKINKYTQSAKELADTTRYDINNLPKEIKDELTYFVADLINQMRRQLGLPDMVLSNTSLEFAQKVAKEYVKANFSKAMEDEYVANGGVGHYAIGINKVAKEYGLDNTYSDEENRELEAKGWQSYENAVTTYSFHDFDDADGVYRKTLGEMKAKLYKDLVMLVSTKNDYAHTQGVLNFDYADETVYFGGVAQSKTDDFYTTHFLTSIRSSYVDVEGSKWDKTPIANPFDDSKREKMIADARQALADAMENRKNAQATYNTLAGEQKQAEATLSQAENTLTALKNEASPLADAQKAFDNAKSTHDKAVVTLANAKALVASLNASRSAKEQALKDANATLSAKEAELANAKEALKAEEAKMVDLQAQAEKAGQVVSVAEKALEDAKANVAKAEKELADLKGSKVRLAELKDQLAKAQADLKDAYKAQNEAKVDYELKSFEAGRAKTAYDVAKAKFDKAEAKRLADEAEKQRKELEKAGYKPVPVVDAKGNVVDYKAEKVIVGTKGDKTYQAPAQATNTKAEPKKQLPNTGTKESNLLALLGASLGLLALVGKRKFR